MTQVSPILHWRERLLVTLMVPVAVSYSHSWTQNWVKLCASLRFWYNHIPSSTSEYLYFAIVLFFSTPSCPGFYIYYAIKKKKKSSNSTLQCLIAYLRGYSNFQHCHCKESFPTSPSAEWPNTNCPFLWGWSKVNMMAGEILLLAEGLTPQGFLLSWARFRILFNVPIVLLWSPLVRKHPTTLSSPTTILLTTPN